MTFNYKKYILKETAHFLWPFLVTAEKQSILDSLSKAKSVTITNISLQISKKYRLPNQSLIKRYNDEHLLYVHLDDRLP